MDETMKGKKSRWSIFLTGLTGFLLAALVGILTGFLFFRLGIYQWLVNLVPDDQPLVRLLTALILTFVGVGLAGAAYGLMCGIALYRVDPQGSRRRYLLGGAFAYGITYGILLIPLLLLISLFAQYNQGSSKDPFSFLALFGLIGLIYGLLSGLVLALVTVKVRYSWLAILASTAGGLLGGMLVGFLIWRHDISLSQPTPALQGIVFFLYLALALAGLVGGLLALAYDWANRKRAGRTDGKVEPHLAQDIVIITTGVLLFVLVVNLTNTLIEFVTIHTGTTTTSLGSETQGVGWSDPLSLTENSVLDEASALDLESNLQGQLSAAWTFDQDGKTEVAYAFQQGDDAETAAWSSPVNVSNSSEDNSTNPQLGIGPDDSIHIVWSEETSPDQWEIRYRTCEGENCTPGVTLSTLDPESCQLPPGQQDWPAIAVSADGSIGITWNAGGQLAYTISKAGESPAANPASCFQPTDGANPDLQPRIAAGEAGTFSVVFGTKDAEGNEAVHLLEISPDGTGSETRIGSGRFPEIYRDSDGKLHLAWCDLEGNVNYTRVDGQVQMIPSPPCTNRPGILQDEQGNMHLAWYSGQVEDNFGGMQPGHFLYESAYINGVWSPPAIVAQLAQAASPAVASRPDAGLSILWGDAPKAVPALYIANQSLYQCDPDRLAITSQAVLDVVQNGEFHPVDYQSPFCNNQFKTFIYMPEPNPAFTSIPVTPNGGFDLLREYIQSAEYELLISNMQWDADQDELSPGFQVVEGVAALYDQIHANPSAYPRGLTVRILLGNYPNLATFEYGDQIWNVIEDLRKAGVEKMEDPGVGWKLEVANFKGSYPHSHTKFIVVDGTQLVSAGFNISWLHLPDDHPSGKGDDLTDMGMLVEGPVAQPALVAFDDEWEGSNQVYCSDLKIGEESFTWQKSCEWTTGVVSHVPEVLKYRPVDEGSAAFALYRTDVYKEADRAYSAAIVSAESSIDAIHVNFSADMICLLNLIAPDTCTFENALPWMESLVDAVEKNDVQVRVIVENANSNGLENRVGIDILEKELIRLGLEDNVEVRFFNGRVHTKSALVDGKLLFVGSQNFHYSSFAEAGLLEFVAATESEVAIQNYQDMFEYYWAQAIPSDEAVWGTTD